MSRPSDCGPQTMMTRLALRRSASSLPRSCRARCKPHDRLSFAATFAISGVPFAIRLGNDCLFGISQPMLHPYPNWPLEESSQASLTWSRRVFGPPGVWPLNDTSLNKISRFRCGLFDFWTFQTRCDRMSAETIRQSPVAPPTAARALPASVRAASSRTPCRTC